MSDVQVTEARELLALRAALQKAIGLLWDHCEGIAPRIEALETVLNSTPQPSPVPEKVEDDGSTADKLREALEPFAEIAKRKAALYLKPDDEIVKCAERLIERTTKPLPDLIVTKGGVPFEDQAEGIRQFKEACFRNPTPAVSTPQPERMVSREAVDIARDCFLNMIADATRFDEEVDGDVDSEGRQQMAIDYHMTVGHSQLQELAESLGIKSVYTETIGDAIGRVLAADALINTGDVKP